MKALFPRRIKESQGRINLFCIAIHLFATFVVISMTTSCAQTTGTDGSTDISTNTEVGWRHIDNTFAYDGPLGPVLHENGTATIRMWSPLADSVAIQLYDKSNQDEVIAENMEMQLGDRGVWSIDLNQENTGLESLNGYYYHLKVTHEGETKLALDPYAKSMATFNNEAYSIGKAAIIDPTAIGSDIELDYAEIEGWEKKEDTVIWEIHVRDLTVDPSIEEELNAPFGTFEAAIDKLDYIQSLGVTHIQLLPVMSYYFCDEGSTRKREMEYSAQNNNFNWGYDPHSYFSLTGMYSANPDDAELRVLEFKHLIQAIHDRGMGVILDVVYNHTSNVFVFEDLVPGYYHFEDENGKAKESFGGGRLGTTHAMSRRIMVDSIRYWTETFKVDGFRFDMMGDHDAESVQLAFDTAEAINPNVVMIGEGWRTFTGDDGDPRQPADQDWMASTSAVAVFSDDMRNEFKSGYGNEGERRFITGGARSIETIFNNIKAQPTNFVADDPGDVVSYMAAHDNLTLHDVIAYSIQKDPDIPEAEEEIQRRIRLGNAMLLTSQGVAFLHAGQEYGRTKQWRAEGKPEHKETLMLDLNGTPFQYRYFVHDSFDSSDVINQFEWAKVRDPLNHPNSVHTKNYTTGLIALRRSTDAFRIGEKALVDERVKRLEIPEINDTDVAIAYSCEASNGDIYYVFVNADDRKRTFSLIADLDLTHSEVLVDLTRAGTEPISNPTGVSVNKTQIELAPLTVAVLKTVKI